MSFSGDITALYSTYSKTVTEQVFLLQHSNEKQYSLPNSSLFLL